MNWGFVTISDVLIQSSQPILFIIMNSVRSNSLSLKYQKFPMYGQVAKFEFVGKKPVLLF